jgi:hypothetical protein
MRRAGRLEWYIFSASPSYILRLSKRGVDLGSVACTVYQLLVRSVEMVLLTAYAQFSYAVSLLAIRFEFVNTNGERQSVRGQSFSFMNNDEYTGCVCIYDKIQAIEKLISCSQNYSLCIL